ncbi:arginine--tRNA ligase [Thermosulfurimonas dismutans]|uniref:Arginine--tRNA ligase n=1 Tax=Thermosulfurimonas dismutans TaxID=999894 RepID=A0A179D3R4_9BACT|nr:arginine--tRNA ligase [Thermosulfurimonas dismutans]OAQ20268.1 Arginyl-tRNA synthetase [Thermosulfurimonas dismutans]
MIVKKIREELLKHLPEDLPFKVEPPREEAFGDYATNAALVLAGRLKRPPRELADELAGKLSARADLFSKVEVAGPGFINFFVAPGYWQSVVKEVLSRGEDYGRSELGRGRKVQVEFVSANPTGPLHIGHGRGAAVGDTLARILSFAGYEVVKEYYVNDRGRQMEILGRSVWLRARELSGEKIDFPEDHYRGDYIKDLARKLLAERPNLLTLPEEEAVAIARDFALREILEEIKQDLIDFGVSYDVWYSERGLYERGEVEEALRALSEAGHLYEKEGALWFRASAFGDEKDRVVRRSNGEPTYFASDIAYHREKFLKRGFDLVVDVWGADHHGYVPRLKAVLSALEIDPERLQVLLIQMVNLIEGGKLKSMSTRAGEFVTLRELMDEVGRDAVRFTFLTRKCDAPLEFDVELAKRQSQENPVYYVQYAHARLSSVFRKTEEAGLKLETFGDADYTRLDTPEDFKLFKLLDAFPQVVEDSARSLEPHRLTYFLLDLATAFHDYYTKHRFLSEDEELSRARLALARAVKQVLKTGLNLLGVSAPERM